MHILYINILMFNFGVFYMFRIRGFIVRKTVVYAVMVWYVVHVSVKQHSLQSSTCKNAYADTCNKRVYTTVFLKMNPRLRNT